MKTWRVSEKFYCVVTLAKAGVQKALKRMDSRFRGNDHSGLEKGFSVTC